MKNAAALIRYYEWQVDDRRKVLAELFSSIEVLDREDEALTVSSGLEQVKASSIEVGSVSFPGFAQGVIVKRNRIHILRMELEKKIQEAQDALQLAFQDLKKIEILEARRKATEAADAERREQAELDEIARDRHLRNGG